MTDHRKIGVATNSLADSYEFYFGPRRQTMRTTEEIKNDLDGFAKPRCESCFNGGEPALDDHGFFCQRCGDEIPNGAEFDDILAELRACRKQ